MTEPTPAWLVLEDEAGRYYLLDARLLERGRVPPERRAFVEAQLAAEDTTGFAVGAASPPAAGIYRAIGIFRPADGPDAVAH